MNPKPAPPTVTAELELQYSDPPARKNKRPRKPPGPAIDLQRRDIQAFAAWILDPSDPDSYDTENEIFDWGPF